MPDCKDKRTSEIRRRNETLQISLFFLTVIVCTWRMHWSMAGADKSLNRGQAPSRPRWKTRNLNAGHVRWLTTRQVASLRDSTVIKVIKFCVEIRQGSGRNMKDESGCRSGSSGCGDDIIWWLDIAIGPISDRKL